MTFEYRFTSTKRQRTTGQIKFLFVFVLLLLLDVLVIKGMPNCLFLKRNIR